MDVVKQRKKRLMVWLLILGLCFGQQGGQVLATEGTGTEDNGSNVEENITDNGEMLGESTSETEQVGDTTVLIPYSDNLVSESQRTFSEGVVLSDDGNLSISVDNSSIEIGATTKEQAHELLEWTMEGSGGQEGTGKTVSPISGYSFEYCSNLNVTWGKVLVLKDAAGNTIAVCAQDKLDQEKNVSLPETVEEMSSEGMEICHNGLFFSEWVSSMSGGSVKDNVFTSDFQSAGTYMELEITTYGKTQVPCSGTFDLYDTETYILGNTNETWTVGDDGYEYSGGISFVGPGSSYSYTRK